MAAFTNYDMFVTGIYFLSVNVRDTLTYLGDKFNNSVEAFHNQKKQILAKIQPGTPFRHFCDNNKDSGEKIVGIIDNFMEDVYSDDSTILRTVDGIIIPDNAQFIKIIEYVVGLHETLTDITSGYVKNADKSNAVVNPALISLITLGDQFYRSCVHVCLANQLQDLFKSFHTAMAESKGQKNENTNYWNGEISKVVTFLNFVEQKTPNPDTGLQLIYEKFQELVKYMNGELKLPEGQQIWPEFEECKKLAYKYFAKVLPEWQNKNQEVGELCKAYVEQAQKLMAEKDVNKV